MKELSIIGRVERVTLPNHAELPVPAKIDTGADASSIWAHKIELKDGALKVVFFGPDSKYYNGEIYSFLPNEYQITRVSNSFGHKELRYKIKLKIKIKDRLINGSFTLSDRSTKLYPILIGRRLIKNKFLVDVSKGEPLVEEEKLRRLQFQEEMVNIKKEDVL